MSTLNKTVKRIHPKKFALWMGIVGMIMFFSAFTSAYIVRKASANWYNFPLPNEFFYSTIAILGSSLAFYLSKKAYLKADAKTFKGLYFLGFLLGFAFIGLQYAGWESLQAVGIDLVANQSSSFLYLITAAHVLHVMGGVVALVVLAVGLIRGRFDVPTPKRTLKIDLTFTYWHFVDILWLYLLVFFLIQQ
ncbi:cytochrome c oxidase subunit 3 [Saprospira grandis]|nr:cytochrome c oxidase subunit 3 [Saprospira grandis]WBM75748.1 cytochrome c oxidase subunit 3 [Saprospira grandis]